jgi:hypothetical protein
MELNFEKQDFDKLLYRVHEMPDNADPNKYFASLSQYHEFKMKKVPLARFNQIFRWVVYMYDMKSPFRNLILDATKRKIEIAKYVKLIINPNELDPLVRDLLIGKSKEVNRMVVAYCRIQKSSRYSLTVGLENKFYNDLEKTMGGENTRNPIAQTQRELEESVLEFLNQDNNPFVAETLFQYIEEERIDNYKPEGIATSLAKGEDPFDGEDIENDTY